MMLPHRDGCLPMHIPGGLLLPTEVVRCDRLSICLHRLCVDDPQDNSGDGVLPPDSHNPMDCAIHNTSCVNNTMDRAIHTNRYTRGRTKDYTTSYTIHIDMDDTNNSSRDNIHPNSMDRRIRYMWCPPPNSRLVGSRNRVLRARHHRCYL